MIVGVLPSVVGLDAGLCRDLFLAVLDTFPHFQPAFAEDVLRQLLSVARLTSTDVQLIVVHLLQKLMETQADAATEAAGARYGRPAPFKAVLNAIRQLFDVCQVESVRPRALNRLCFMELAMFGTAVLLCLRSVLSPWATASSFWTGSQTASVQPAPYLLPTSQHRQQHQEVVRRRAPTPLSLMPLRLR